MITVLAQESIPYLSKPYYRVDSKGSQYSDPDPGLYIYAEIIEKHDHEIGVSSGLGKGSVTRPVKTIH